MTVHRLTATAGEMAQAHAEADRRQRRHDRFSLADQFEPIGDRRAVDYRHALAEILTARFLGRAWSPSKGPRAALPLDPFRVHSTPNESGQLLVSTKPGERPLVHVLVIGPEGDGATFAIVGTIIGEDAQDRYPVTHSLRLACHVVPQADLTPLRPSRERQPTQRACACGCGTSLAGKRPHARYATAACRTKGWNGTHRNGRETGRKASVRDSAATAAPLTSTTKPTI